MNIYFAGIGGVGLGPLAEIATDAGYQVAGSDQHDSLTVQNLKQCQIPISFAQDGSFLRQCHAKKPVDWFVYTSALPDNHPELETARALGLKISKRDELLAHIIAKKQLKLVAIAGTHGKTTTTSMFVWTLKQLGIPVSYSIGTTLSFGKPGVYNPKSQYFVYECDEFDRNFLAFHPYLSLIPALDYDHSETYPTQTDYLAAFSQFAHQSQYVLGWSDQHPEAFTNLTNVDLESPNNAGKNISLPGHKIRRNAGLVQRGLQYLNISQPTNSILSSFPGVDRRFEKLADNLYTDYAHLPAEIATTIDVAREVNPQVVVVYQPHQNIRQHELLHKYQDCFKGAEIVYWLPTYLTREDPTLAILTPNDLIAQLTDSRIAQPTKQDETLWKKITQARHDGKLVLVLGAGPIDGWLRQRILDETTSA